MSHISKLLEDEISSLLDAVTIMIQDKEPVPKPACPRCAIQAAIRYSFKCKKQLFFCKNCGHTFVTTTNIIMVNSHFPFSVWKEMIADTLHGNSIDFSAKRFGLHHQAAFDMCHKILMALVELPATADICLGMCLNLMKPLSLTAIKVRNWTPGQGVSHANMVQSFKKRHFL